MTDPIQIKNQLRRMFPVFEQSELIEDIVANGQLLQVPANTVILKTGSVINIIPLALTGRIKIIREDNNGKELFLYFISPGQSCAMTLASCLKREKSAVKAIVEEEATILALPVEAVYRFMYKYPSWVNFIVDIYSNRFDELLAVLDGVCFEHIDARLVKYLRYKSKITQSKELIISHKEIAMDLGTSREVISRLLKQMERKNAVELHRGKIKILNLKYY